jgi:dipeptidyl-peptidase-4
MQPWRWRSALRLTILAASLLGGLAGSPALAQQPAQQSLIGLSVEKIYARPGLAVPLVRGIEWSPDGKLLSYFHRSGTGASAKTELYAIDVAKPEFPGRLLVDADRLKELLPPSNRKDTQATGIGRVAATQYEWAPSGRALLFISSDNLYWFDLASQKGRRLLGEPSSGEPKDIKDARISPDGRWVSFVRNHDLWSVEVASGKESRLTGGGTEEVRNGELDWVYPEELSLHEAYWWSPDSSQIAFLQFDERPVTKYPLVNLLSYTGETEGERYPKAGDANPIVKVGIVNLTSAATERRQVWMDTGADTNVYIPRVAWLPDSRQLAIQRLNRAQNKLELLFADVASGKSRVILTDEDKFWVNVHDDLTFLNGGKAFLWSSETAHPGAAPNAGQFRHLYVFDMEGKLTKQLTRGDWEVTAVNAVDEKRGFVSFTATKDGVRERQLYRVSLDGGEPVRITQNSGTHAVRLSPGADFYVDQYSTALAPPQQFLATIPRLGGGEAGAPLALGGEGTPTLEQARLLPVEFFTIPAKDGTPLEAMMIKPAGFDPAKKYPVIVSLYGGPHAQLVVNSWGGATFLFNELLAQNGYIIFTLDNHGSFGRGHAFETPIYHHMGEVELADQLSGVDWLKKQAFVDAARIGVRGWSYGGYMTCTAMFNAADVFKAGFAGSPVTDWRQYDTIYTERYMGTPQENPEGYKNSAPANHAANLRGKLLIAAGTGDDNVHFANTIELAEHLINAGKYAEVQLYPGRGHGISDEAAQLHLFRHVLEFFLNNL